MAWASLYALMLERKYLRSPTIYSALHSLGMLVPGAVRA